MNRAIVRFLTQNRAGRRLTNIIHPLIHPGIRPYTFAARGCRLCRFMWRTLPPPPLFRDESHIKISEPEYNEDGSIKKYGLSMNATVQRQIDALVAKDPELGKKLEEAMNNIATDIDKKE